MAATALPPLSAAMIEAHHSGIREISNVALTMPGAIRLEVGQPDFRTPEHIAEAGKRAIDEGFTQYTHTQGIMPLREAIAEKLGRVNGIHVPAAQIACGPGGVGVLAAAMASLLDPGDEILMPDPGWPNTSIMVSWARGAEVRYPCPPELGFQPDLERMRLLITPRTRAILVNSPNNPTGAAYSAETLAEIAEIARRHNLWVISDECYDQIMLDGTPVAPSMAAHLGDERVVSVFTFSKTYAMTGWRLGYGTGPAEVIDSMTKFLESSSSCVSTITQHAGLAALKGPQDRVAEMVAAYRRRKELAVDLLEEAGLLIAQPRGAFYIMADVSGSGLDAREFAFKLLREREVGVAPGTAFGSTAAGAVRISLASADADLREGIGRLADLVRTMNR
ncbi:MAG TPA: pyridoxal phosphate-dependent aminotransferase [Candidatus Dormibacteraeota bacterium]